MAPKTPNAESRVRAAFDAARDRSIEEAADRVGSARRQSSFSVLRSLLPGRSMTRYRSQPRTFLGLMMGIALSTIPTAADAFNPILPMADPPASEGCCGTEDQDYTFRGYTVELWDEAPTISELDCPNQDDACLLNQADQISRVYHLQAVLVSRAALWRAQHFDKGPLVAGAFFDAVASRTRF